MHARLALGHEVGRADRGRLLGRDLENETSQWVYVGDSTNDQAMFAHFPLSVGVANLRRFAEQLTVWPAYLADGEVPQPMGTAYKALLPYQTFRTKTRDLALAVGSDRLWRIFCPLLGLGEMLDDPRYATNAARNDNRATIVAE